MKKIFILLVASFVLLVSEIKSQEIKNDSVKFDIVNLGLGIGMEYGGIGGNLTVYPVRYVGIFAGGGYALASFGYNVGIKVRLVSKTKYSTVNPYFHGMYGYNASIKVQNADKYNKLFYGPTIGFGMDFGPRKPGKGYFTVAINFPIRSSEVEEYIDDLEENHGVEFNTGLLPFAFSVAYRISLK